MKYTFRNEKELQGAIQASADIPQKVIDNAKFHIGLVEECFEDGACGNFHTNTLKKNLLEAISNSKAKDRVYQISSVRISDKFSGEILKK